MVTFYNENKTPPTITGIDQNVPGRGRGDATAKSHSSLYILAIHTVETWLF